MVWLIVVGWLICGVLGYGVCKNWWRQFMEKIKGLNWTNTDEGLAWLIALFGPAGLVEGILFTYQMKYKFGLCYRMPKELCEPRHFEERDEEREKWGAAENLRELWEKGPNDLRHPE